MSVISVYKMSQADILSSKYKKTVEAEGRQKNIPENGDQLLKM